MRLSGRERRLVGFLTGLILVAFLLALGKNTPVFPWLYRTVPTFASFQAPARFTLWAVFSLGMLAALGAQNWRRPQGKGLYWTRLGTAGAAAAGLGAGLVWLAAGRIAGDISPGAGLTAFSVSAASVRATAIAGAFGVAAGALALAAPPGHQGGADRYKTGWWQWAVVIILALDLIIAGWGLNPSASVQVYQNQAPGVEQMRGLAGGGRLYLPPEDEQELRYERFFRFDRFNAVQDWTQVRAALLPNTNMLEGLPSANNFDPLLPGRYVRWMEKLADVPEKKRQAMLNLMGVSLVETMDESRPNEVNFSSRPALPRLRWSPCAIHVMDGEAALERTLANLEQPDTLVVEGEPLPQPTNCRQEDTGSVRLIAENPNQIEVRTQAGAPGFLLLADTWYPGWQAWVDGRPAPLLRANYLFRAVPLPAGEHMVAIGYRPAWFYLGAALSGLAWMGLFAGVAWSRR
jgi:hypothetical protein